MRKGQFVERPARGFTLLEIMVAITILGLVAGVTSVAVMHALHEAQVKTTIESIRGCEEALQLYLLKHGRYPDSSQGLQVLVAEGLLKRPASDAWGNELHYGFANGRYTVVSYGSDGAPGGDDYARDLSGAELP
jgi:general secretion pathway protein G